MHARVSIAVRDVDVPALRDREVRWPVERRRSVRDRREVGSVVAALGRFSGVVSERQEQLSVRRELAH